MDLLRALRNATGAFLCGVIYSNDVGSNTAEASWVAAVLF